MIITIRRYERLLEGRVKFAGCFECSDWQEAFARLERWLGEPVPDEERAEMVTMPGNWCVESYFMPQFRITSRGVSKRLFAYEVECLQSGEAQL